MTKAKLLKEIPSVDKLLGSELMAPLLESCGHTRTREAIRRILANLRDEIQSGKTDKLPTSDALVLHISQSIAREDAASLMPVINLTGTVLHTNLGRASLPAEALDAVRAVSEGNSNLEFDLTTGKRGDRDSHAEKLLTELAGAEAATLVNNNAAAVLLCLNTLAQDHEVCISRGELVEIGGSFRIPEIMEKSGCILKEVGATNRTHLRDYEKAINEQTRLLLKVHCSNYEIRGFTREVSYEEVARLAVQRELPFMADLGSGTLVNLENFGLEHEPTVQEVIGAGADIVTFSGDKLLGGPQAGIIAGKRKYVEAIRNNPLKRALRVDKMTIAALTEVLKLYLQPEHLPDRLPALACLTRPEMEIQQLATSLLPDLIRVLKGFARVEVVATESQIGSGALPLARIPSHAIAITPINESDAALQSLSRAFRNLPLPVVGRVAAGRLLLDCRTLDSPARLLDQLNQLALP